MSVTSYKAEVILPKRGLHAVMIPNTRPIAHTLIYYWEHKTWPVGRKLYRCLVPDSFEDNAGSTKKSQ